MEKIFESSFEKRGNGDNVRKTYMRGNTNENGIVIS